MWENVRIYQERSLLESKVVAKGSSKCLLDLQVVVVAFDKKP
jgi:hypothetical protein